MAVSPGTGTDPAPGSGSPQWQSVQRFDLPFGALGSQTHSFEVRNDGTWTEHNPGATGDPGVIVEGTLTRTELRILDFLLDQINREPIPTNVGFTRPPDGDNNHVWIDVDNQPGVVFGEDQRLYDESPALGRRYWSDDKLDVLEITALNLYLEHLDSKYGLVDPPIL
ncbi:hypothetical protein [Microvirga massiliensis]|uniref:hypothetical protein n=1 Tax=Microvirga massiliensis TaxID=1033741 RepID=UPI00062BD06F|nr:hypothetical protein [Microvirga massiliensis]